MKQKLVQNVPRCSQTARSLLQLHRRDPSNWLTYQHLNFLKRQVSPSHCFSLASIIVERYLDLLVDVFSLLYLKGEQIFLNILNVFKIVPLFTLVHLFSFQYVSKNKSELQQRAIPKQAPVLTIVDERDDSVERQVQRISAIDPLVAQTVSEDDTSNTQPEISTLKPMTEDAAVQNDSVSSTETPHINVETDLAREARLEKQWKQLKVDMEELPDVYARLAKIKLTGRVFVT